MTNHTFLSSIAKPGRYLGHEYNSVQKPWDSAQARFALIFPDLYEIGMSHQGIQILYHLINAHESLLAERCFCTDMDAEKLLLEAGTPITTLESGRRLTEFDILGFTLPYELCYTNILTILNLAQIPFFAKDRGEDFPLLLAGGAGAFNPEPVADFFDAILLGDGEEAIIEIGTVLIKLKNRGLTKSEILNELANIEGIYIPAHFSPKYDTHGHVTAIHRTAGSKEHITRRILPDLNDIEHLKHPIVPNAKIVHDRLGIEVARGCTRGCRFCQAGITYRPVRERKPETIIELADIATCDSGFEELALLSLSTGDYSCLDVALPALMNKFSDQFISVAMPSMRVGTLTPAIMDQIKRVRKTGFTLAPEAGSERMRRIINKGITEDDLLSTCRSAFELGWQTMKLYFMIGLPTEKQEDIDAIIELVKKVIKEQNMSSARGKKQINVSVGTFVPKPHTPFQWERQLTINESRDHIHHLKDTLPGKGSKLRYHSPQLSYLEGVFSRGDRRLAKLMVKAWENGARLDGWDEHFNLFRWQESAHECGLDLDDYLRARSFEEILPWQHLQTGVDLQFLKDEYKRAIGEEYTPDCRYHACQKCGLCDFKTLMPVVYNRSQEAAEPSAPPTPRPVSIPGRPDPRPGANEAMHFKYIVHYSRIGDICYLGHLEILQVVFRSLRRAGIETNFSQGFNPSPKISFGPALSVGTESLAEYFIMDLPNPLKDLVHAATLLNSKLPPGLQVNGIEHHSGKIPQAILVSYTLVLADHISDQEKERASQFLDSSSFPVSKTRKGKTKAIDIRPLIKTFEIIEPCTVKLEMVSISSQPGVKPLEAIKEILKMESEVVLKVKVTKNAWSPLTDSGR